MNLEPTQRNLHIRDLNFHVQLLGECAPGKLPVLMLHGFPDTLAVWDAVAPALAAAGHQVIAYDQRGCGQTDMAARTADYALRTIVDDGIAVLDALGIGGPVDVVGHDWGAVIAWGLAVYHPARVRRLVAISVGHPQAYGRSGLAQKFGKGFYTLWLQLRGLAEWYLLKGGAMARWLRSHPDAGPVIARMKNPVRLRAGLSWYRANLSLLVSTFPRCTVPTLGIWSDGDAFLTEAQMTDSARYMDAAWQYQCVKSCGHWIPLEQPDQLARLISSWLSEK
jgi:pimeloyl-ACP methyl ester carboxylesterase